MRAIILAGGKGTRLHPYTVALPKPLVPVGDRSILDIVLAQLRRAGCRHVTMAVNHLAHLIMAYFGDGSRWDMRIDYSLEDKPLSTIGPLKLIADLPETFLVMNGDILTDLDYAALYNHHQPHDRHQRRILAVGFRDRPRPAEQAALAHQPLDCLAHLLRGVHADFEVLSGPPPRDMTFRKRQAQQHAARQQRNRDAQQVLPCTEGHADAGDGPDSGGGRQPDDVSAKLDDCTGTEEPDTGDDLRRDARSIRELETVGHSHRNQREQGRPQRQHAQQADRVVVQQRTARQPEPARDLADRQHEPPRKFSRPG